MNFTVFEKNIIIKSLQEHIKTLQNKEYRFLMDELVAENEQRECENLLTRFQNYKENKTYFNTRRSKIRVTLSCGHTKLVNHNQAEIGNEFYCIKCVDDGFYEITEVGKIEQFR